MTHLVTNLLTPGQSHARGSEEPPLLTECIYDRFASHARAHPQRLALAAPEQSLEWNYFFLKRRCDRAAIGLAELGFEKGDRLGVWMHNNSEWLVMQLATAKLGVILVNMKPDYRLPELEYALDLVGCKGLVMVPKFVLSNAMEMIQILCPELNEASPILNSARVPLLKYVIVTDGGAQKGMIPFGSLYKDSAARISWPASCKEPVNIQFTSGTTGKPKATVLTHENILNNGYFVGRTMNYTSNDIICVPVPLYHPFGCVMGNLAMVAFGCSLVYPAGTFDPRKTLKAVTQHKCTSLYGVPTMFIAMLDHAEFSSFKPSSLRTGIMAGAPCPIDTMNRVIADMGAREITICYGMTETSLVSWQTRLGTPIDLTCTTAGQIHPHLECKVVDPETFETLACNTPGELWIAGYCVMQGYWENENATQEAIIDQDGRRWMRTGDLGVISDKGFCEIIGRIKERSRL